MKSVALSQCKVEHGVGVIAVKGGSAALYFGKNTCAVGITCVSDADYDIIVCRKLFIRRSLNIVVEHNGTQFAVKSYSELYNVTSVERFCHAVYCFVVFIIRLLSDYVGR